MASAAAIALAARAATLPPDERTAAAAAATDLVHRLEWSGQLRLPIATTAIHLLGQLGAVEAVPTLEAIVRERGTDEVTLAAVDALGEIGAASSAPTLVYAYFHHDPVAAESALALTGGAGAEDSILQAWATASTAGVLRGGWQRDSAVRLLGAMGTPAAAAMLRDMLARRDDHDVWPAAVAALAASTLTTPGERPAVLAELRRLLGKDKPDPRRHVNVQPFAIEVVCGGGFGMPISDESWLALDVAPALALLGDPSDVARIAGARATPPLDQTSFILERWDLLLAEAALARHGEADTVAAAVAALRNEFVGLRLTGECPERWRSERLASLDSLAAAVAVARECADGDMACYAPRLSSANADVVRKAALLMAWMASPAARPAARLAILDRIGPDCAAGPGAFNSLWNRTADCWLLLAVDLLSPDGSPECEARVRALAASGLQSASQRTQAAWLLSRLRARARTSSAPAAAVRRSSADSALGFRAAELVATERDPSGELHTR